MGGPQHHHHHGPCGDHHRHHHHPHHHPQHPVVVAVPVPVPVPVHHHDRGVPHVVPVPVPVPMPVHHHVAPRPRILYASYGGADVTSKVQHMYDSHHHKLAINAGEYNNHFGDPFFQQYKDFVVMTLDSTNHIRVHIAAEDQPTHITNGPHHSTPAPHHHHHHGLFHHGGPEILQANYAGLDVTHKCHEIYKHKKHFQLDRPMNEVFGDPLPGIEKVLVVMYMTKKNDKPHRACTYWTENERPNLQ